ncbi:hypothetical protein LSH36_19g12015 [Paralvinella palmiformis]|uniref:C2 domain-containing protein n=1 Tax=Paralvinella palmiformis TaxID=53620 RepID=A0AAD9NID0_9ANNE|nr:hypothetical protein LSH36_19g12015 [Paralvinella palmiformis]
MRKTLKSQPVESSCLTQALISPWKIAFGIGLESSSNSSSLENLSESQDQDCQNSDISLYTRSDLRHRSFSEVDYPPEDGHSKCGRSSPKSLPGSPRHKLYSHRQGTVQKNQRIANLRAYPFFILDIILKEGRELVIRDTSGTSDPYVKFKIGSKVHYRSRIIYKNLNPNWEEKFSMPIEDPFKPVILEVFDRDRGFFDDPMGITQINVSALELNQPTELKLMLKETKKKIKHEYMGFLVVSCTLIPKTQDDKEHVSI